jgi:two-component system sensor histidine kinase CpxA
MKSLFLKIFLSFWIAVILFVALAMVAALAFRPPTESPLWGYIKANTANQLVRAYESGGAPALDQKIDEVEHGLRLHAYLFDENGRELTGRGVPDWAYTLRTTPEPPARPWVQFTTRRFVRQEVTTADGREYVMAAEVPPRPWPLILRERPPGVGLFFAILSSGLVCYFLSRYLTAPVSHLRAAAQQLAAGDLSARADAPPPRRRDEISELVRDFNTMAERLQNLVGAQSRLLNDISHELRSPLARLNVALGLARQRTGPEAQSILERIELEATRLNDLIGRLLTLARLEGGEDAMRRTPFSLDELIRDVGKDADFEAQSRHCRVRCTIEDEVVIVGSPTLIHSAVENVVRNAMRHTADNTEVEIRLRRDLHRGRSEAVISVADQGPGVPKESLDKLFRPFYRLDDARGRQTGGVGLGLAITERAIRLHGGSVTAANRLEGGLEVELRLPFDPELQPASIADTPQPAPERVV